MVSATPVLLGFLFQGVRLRLLDLSLWPRIFRFSSQFRKRRPKVQCCALSVKGMGVVRVPRAPST